MQENNNQPVEHLSDYNYEEVLDRSFTDIPNKSQSATKPKEDIVDIDFAESSANFWRTYEGGKYFQIYNEGVMSGTFNHRQPNFNAILETTFEAIKNIIRIECEKEDKTVEDFTLYLTMLRQSLTLLSSKIDDTLDSKISGELTMAYVHAVFNSFINTNIKQ